MKLKKYEFKSSIFRFYKCSDVDPLICKKCEGIHEDPLATKPMSEEDARGLVDDLINTTRLHTNTWAGNKHDAQIKVWDIKKKFIAVLMGKKEV